MCVPPGVAPWASIPGKHRDAGAGGDGDDSLLTEMFRGGEQRLSSYPELLLQAQPVVGSPGVVKPVQMALQRAHIQLGVSIQEVLQQSLVDEGVLHLRERRHQRGGRTLVLSNLSRLFWHHRHGVVPPPPAPLACLRRDCSERVQLSVRGAAGSGGVSAYICLDELTALLSYSAHGAEDIHPLFRVHHVDHAVNDDKRPGPPHPGAAEREKRNRRRRLTNMRATPERFVSRKGGVGTRTLPLGAVSDSSERV